MVSYHYARQVSEETRIPLLVDLRRFASLLPGGRVVTDGEFGVLELTREDQTDRTYPADILDLQERLADIAFTLDFPISPGMDEAEATRRQALTVRNATWALANRRRKDLLLFACIQGWDVPSVRDCARQLAAHEFDGFAVGGLVPRARDLALVTSIVRAVRDEVGDRPLPRLRAGQAGNR